MDETKGNMYLVSRAYNEKRTDKGKASKQNVENNEKESTNEEAPDSRKKYLRIIPMKRLFTESKSVNGMRFCLGVVCLAVFLYFAFENTERYLANESMVTLNYEQPDNVDLPAITICGPFIISPLTLHKLDKNYNPDYNSSMALSKLRDPFWVAMHKKEFNAVEQYWLEHSPIVDILENKSLELNDLVNNCVYMNYTIDDGKKDPNARQIDCKDIADWVGSIYDGRKCFTMFSRINNFKIHGLKMR